MFKLLVILFMPDMGFAQETKNGNVHRFRLLAAKK